MTFRAEERTGFNDSIDLDQEGVVAVPDRRCGRCQCAFPGDPTLFFQTDWALCPTCEAILLPGRPPAQ
jgi:hypothetical protein